MPFRILAYTFALIILFLFSVTTNYVVFWPVSSAGWYALYVTDAEWSVQTVRNDRPSVQFKFTFSRRNVAQFSTERTITL